MSTLWLGATHKGGNTLDILTPAQRTMGSLGWLLSSHTYGQGEALQLGHIAALEVNMQISLEGGFQVKNFKIYTILFYFYTFLGRNKLVGERLLQLLAGWAFPPYCIRWWLG